MNVSEIFDYLITKERERFTGAITLNFHNGDLSNKVEKKQAERIEK